VELPAPPDKAPPPPPTAEFTLHHVFPAGRTGNQYAFGITRNTSDVPIRKPRITVVMLDAAGDELDTDFGFPDGHVLEPGASTPTRILIKKPPEYAKLAFEINPKQARYIPEQAQGLRLEPQEPEPGQYTSSYWVFKGKVHNEGKSPARYVKITILGLDADDKIIGMGYTYADGERLQPGSYGRYQTQIKMFEKPKRFSLSVQGRVAQ
jgi:hypothetical protein